MELEKAKKHYQRKKRGKCAKCEYSRQGHIVDESFCLVREEVLYYSIAYDYIRIKLCRYYKPMEEKEC